MESHTVELADIERERLEGILSLVFDKGHYEPECLCERCRSTRQSLSTEDLQFVDHAVRTVGNSNAG